MATERLTNDDVVQAVATLNALRIKGATLAAASLTNPKGFLVCAQSAQGKVKKDTPKPWHTARMTPSGLDLWGMGYRVADGTSDYQRNGAIYGFARSYASALADLEGKTRAGVNGRQRIVPGSLYIVPGYLVAQADYPNLEAALRVAYRAWVDPASVVGGWPPASDYLRGNAYAAELVGGSDSSIPAAEGQVERPAAPDELGAARSRVRLSDLTTESVLLAIAQYDDLGQRAFFEEYGFSNALEYFLLHGGKAYDSKAIAGVAHGYVTGDFRGLNNFSGGLPVARRLRDLGFEVTGGSDWEWDELILACDLVASNDWQTIPEDHPQVRALSDYLRAQQNARYSERFRSTGSVYRKLEDLRTAHPGYSGTRTRGGKATRRVVDAFVAEPDKMHRLAEELWRNGNLGRTGWDGLGGTEEEPGGDDGAVYAEAVEGRVVERLVRVRERDPKLRRGKIEQSRKERGCISCEACEFDFEKVYGQLGHGFIHVHHRVPLHFSGETKSTFDDLALLCVNCHQMIHRHSPWKTLEELRAIIAGTIR